MEHITPIEAFIKHAHSQPDKTLFHQPMPEGELVEVTYAEALDTVCRLAAWLQRYPPASRIGILSLNCMHWFMTDLAIMLAGHVSVPIYPTANSSTINQILEHSECACLFVGKMPPERANIQFVDTSLDLVSMFTYRPDYQNWSLILETEPLPVPDKFPDMAELATIIYTSGTTSMPKGVMINYQAVAATGEIVMDWIGIEHTDRFFSYLPLAHAAERTAIEIACLYAGAEVSFTGSLETFNADLVRARPTVFFGVPRIWAKFQQAIESKIPTSILSLILATPIMGGWFARKLRQKLGLDAVKVAVSGAAALPIKTLNWFDRLGIPICEAYGMSESLGIATFNHHTARQPGSVGRPLPGTELKITDNDEVIYKNTSLMAGYYREPLLTEQALQDGWLYTGDTGRIDEQGFLWITGRIKDIFKTEKGKYIAPLPIESELLPRSGLEQLCVMGTGLIQPVVVAPLASKPSGAELERLETRLALVLDEINQHLAPNERLSHWFLVAEEWTTDNQLITPTLKVKRQSVEDRYGEAIRLGVRHQDPVQWLPVVEH